jgi:hypothetical protein
LATAAVAIEIQKLLKCLNLALSALGAQSCQLLDTQTSSHVKKRKTGRPISAYRTTTPTRIYKFSFRPVTVSVMVWLSWLVEGSNEYSWNKFVSSLMYESWERIVTIPITYCTYPNAITSFLFSPNVYIDHRYAIILICGNILFRDNNSENSGIHTGAATIGSVLFGLRCRFWIIMAGFENVNHSSAILENRRPVKTPILDTITDLH